MYDVFHHRCCVLMCTYDCSYYGRPRYSSVVLFSCGGIHTIRAYMDRGFILY